MRLEGPPLLAKAHNSTPRNVAAAAADVHGASAMNTLVPSQDGLPPRTDGVIAAALKSLINVVRRDIEVCSDRARATFAVQTTIQGRYCVSEASNHAANPWNGVPEREKLLASGGLLNNMRSTMGWSTASCLRPRAAWTTCPTNTLRQAQTCARGKVNIHQTCMINYSAQKTPQL